MWMDHLERGKLWRGLRAHHGVDIFEGLQNKKKQPNRKPCSREPGGLQSLKYLRGGPTHYLEDWRIYFQAATENVKFPWSPVYLHTLWKPVILSRNMLVFVLLFKNTMFCHVLKIFKSNGCSWQTGSLYSMALGAPLGPEKPKWFLPATNIILILF